MLIAPNRENECEALTALLALGVLDTAPEPEFDAMVSAAARLCDMPISLVSLVDADRQWFKANVGLPGVVQTPRDLAFCAHAVLGDGLFEVPDATLDERFHDNPLVLGQPNIRFYAGVPLRLSNGLRVGTLCVLDRQARRLDDEQRQLLIQLAAATARSLEGRQAIRDMAVGDLHCLDLDAELARHHDVLGITLRSITDAVITTDADASVAWLNPVAERMTGWSAAQAKGLPLTKVFRVIREQFGVPMTGSCEAARALLLSRDGQEFSIVDVTEPIRNRRGDVLGSVLVFHDVTEHQRMVGEMSYRATHDALTGLLNRTEFETQLNRVLLRAHGDGSTHALIFVDLDQFKLVNDAGGHAAGDLVLKQVAALMSEVVRSSDALARLSADEFAIILEQCTVVQAQRVAQQICDRLDSFRFAHGDNRFRIGASLGLVPIDQRWDTTAAILQAADSACLAAREAGGNRVQSWSDKDVGMQARHGEMQWATRIEQALDEDLFVLFAQRIESLQEESTGLHAEVLLRMSGPDGEVIPPGAFLPAAERFHLASRIDRWVLKRAIAWLKSLPSLAMVHNLSVNLSGQSVSDPSFQLWANEVLREAGQPLCQCLCLEVTETAMVTNIADAALFFKQLRAAGVRVALDDFGAGASSFGYLKSLPIDYLKIDGQFIRHLLTDALDEATVRCFADIAKVVGVKTVAEFVDQPEVLRKLCEMGIDYAQGFLLHRPTPIDELLTRTSL